jgi:hypothetical protein
MATNTNMKNIENLTEALNQYVIEFLSEFKGDTKGIKHALKAWQKDQAQEALAALVKENAPKAKVTRVTKAKGPKDKNAPKGAKSGYILFCGDERASVVEDNPEMKAPDVLKELGARWKAMKASEPKSVKKYEKAAKKDKKRATQELEEYKETEEYATHQEAVEAWKQSGSPQLGRKGKSKKVKKDKNAPKGACSAYILFCGDERTSVKEAYPEMANKDVLRELGKRWKAMKASTGKKDKKRVRAFEKAAKADKVRATQELEEYKETQDYADYQVVVAEWEANGGTPKRKTSTKAKKDPNAPTKARSAYIFFCKDMREGVKDDNPEFDSKEVTRELSRMWKEDYAEEEERAVWNRAAKVDKKRYRKEFKAYTPADEEDDDEEVSEVESAPSSPKKSPKKAKKSPKKSKAKKSVKAAVQVQAAVEESEDEASDSEDLSEDEE